MKRVALLFCMFFAWVCGVGAQTFVGTSAPPQAYGAQGVEIPLQTTLLPTTATVSVTQDSFWQWAPGATCWYNYAAVQVSVSFSDTLTHQVTLYIQDYDHQGRIEKINGTQFQNFTGGEYAVYDVTGSAQFTVKRVAGPNAVLNGIYFDAPPSQVATAPMHEVILNWTASTSSGVTGYEVFRNGTPLAALGVVTTYTDTTVQAGQTYSFTVAAVSGSTQSAQAPVTAFTIPSP